MKIFSNFDTKLRQKTFEEYQAKYGVENVLCFGRSRLYQIYKIILPFSGALLLTIFGLIFFYRRLGGDYFSYIVTAVLIIDTVFFFPIIGKTIDYKMDFIIVIPHAIMMYDQGGLFKRNVITISVQSIKAISIKKAGLFYSMFDNGDIIILTEGDSEHNGEIKFRRIPRPDKRRDQIVRVIGMEEDPGSIVTPVSDPTPDLSTTV
ncbi:MAG: PH domain-containing protein [Candidatus Absconditabacterales bacterium]